MGKTKQTHTNKLTANQPQHISTSYYSLNHIIQCLSI